MQGAIRIKSSNVSLPVGTVYDPCPSRGSKTAPISTSSCPTRRRVIESLRTFGYNPQTAIADLLDNSLSAEAQNIWLFFFWDGPDSFVSILDDGVGMTEEALREAMRPGSKSPLEIRHPRDLGRFGLGLKTASFSQCRRLTVCSKVRGRAAVRCWDLDHVQQTREWRLLRTVPPETQARLAPLAKKKQGTIVLWEKMDRLVQGTDPNSTEDHRRFLDLSEDVERHLGMVFHRFLEGKKPVSMFINGTDAKHRVKPWDPFLAQFDATQKLPAESIETSSGTIEISAFVLPHHDRLGASSTRRQPALLGGTPSRDFTCSETSVSSWSLFPLWSQKR